MVNESQHKVIAVLEFLQELMTIDKQYINNITQHHWYQFIDSLPKAMDNVKINYLYDTINDFNSEERVLVEIEKPKFSPCPKYPTILSGWIDTYDWDNFKTKDIYFRNERLVDEENVEKFNESKERLSASEEWLKARNVWRNEELIKQEVQEVFDKFYSIYEDLKTDSEKIELMIGNGIFGEASNSNQHPLLLKRVKIIYDKKTKMKIIDSDRII